MTLSMSTDKLTPVPVPPNRLVGRELDLTSLSALLADDTTRLITLTGPGGVGKTHLSLELAAAVAPRFPDGVAYVPLASVREPDMVLPAIAQALGIRQASGESLIETLGSALSGQRALILLDNLEQVLDAAPDIGVLLAATASPVFVATSRSPLHLRAEREYPVPTLPMPDPGTSEPNAAVALFVERAQAVRPSFSMTAENSAAILEICRRLDGLPLAIELAAAMIRVLPPQALLSRMGQRLHLNIAGASDLPDRQRTLRDTIAWSHDLLDAQERQVFYRLAVFASGAPLEGIEIVCRDIPSPDILGIVISLVDKNLLFRIDDADDDSEPRFRMLSTIREFALDQLDASAEAQVARCQHLQWLLEVSEQAETALVGPDQARWLHLLDTEHDNIRVALAWAHEHAHASGMRLASRMWRYWATRGLFSEGRTWLTRFLDAPVDVDDDLRARTLGSRGNIELDIGDYAAAAEAYTQALAIRERIGPDRGIADALNGLGLVDGYRGDFASARERHSRSLDIRRRIGDQLGLGNSLTNLGDAYKGTGELETARALHEEALAVRQAMGHRGGVGFSYFNLADIARRLGDVAEAHKHLNKSLATFREIGDRLGIGYAMHGLGLAELLAGEPREAADHFAEALSVRANLGDRRGMIECIEGIAMAAAALDRPMQAATLFGAAGALREQIGASMPAPDRDVMEPAVESIRRGLPEFMYRDSRDQGASLTLSEAAELAITTAREIAEAPVVRVTGVLSEREVEVVQLVASGLTNAQVADRLFLSRRTVDAHLRRIYDKLGLSSRTEIVRYALEHGFA